MTEVVEHRDGLDDAVDGDLAERRNARRHDGNAAGKALTQLRARMRAVLVSMTKLRCVFRSGVAVAVAQAERLGPEPQFTRLTGQA